MMTPLTGLKKDTGPDPHRPFLFGSFDEHQSPQNVPRNPPPTRPGEKSDLGSPRKASRRSWSGLLGGSAEAPEEPSEAWE